MENELNAIGDKTFQLIPPEDLTVINIIADRDKETKGYKQIRITLKDGRVITHAPKIKEEILSQDDGFPVIEKNYRLPKKEEMPKVFNEINNILRKKECIINVGYTKMLLVTKDGIRDYYFVKDYQLAELQIKN